MKNTICIAEVLFLTFVTVLADVIMFSQGKNTINHPGSNSFRFASYYTNHVVLQRAPQKAGIWGYASLRDIGKNVTVLLISTDRLEMVVAGIVHKGPFNDSAVWRVLLNPVATSTPHNIIAKLPGYRPIVLTDVLFGDVWLCSGQSNMQFSVLQMFDHQREIIAAKNYSNIRLFNLDRVSSELPLYDIQKIISPWSLPADIFQRYLHLSDDYRVMDGFSAVCYMFGKFLYDKLQYPIGLVDTTWGGTPIEAWSDHAALAKCGLDRRNDDFFAYEPMRYSVQDHPRKNSVIWNAMINPLLNMTVKGAIWYQGEANTKYHTEKYSCSFPAMIESWRAHFGMATGGQVACDMPFGFVQIGPNNIPELDFAYPTIRWHQMMDTISGMPLNNTFMAVAMDLTDPDSPYGQVHIRDKITVARRLSNAALNIVYKQGFVINNFPFPTYEYVNKRRGELWIEFSYGLAQINVRSHNGFEICCSPTYSNCPLNSTTNWIPSPIVKYNSTIVRVSLQNCSHVAAYRYAWRATPCHYHQCAVYSDLSGDPLPTFTKPLKN